MDPTREAVGHFTSALEPQIDAYKNITFSYLAIKQQGRYILSHGRILLHAAKMQVKHGHFECPSLKVGTYPLEQTDCKMHELIEQLLAGAIHIQNDEMVFPTDAGKAFAYYRPTSPNILPQARSHALLITGARRPTLSGATDINWELRSASTPYESLDELLSEHQLNGLQGDAALIEILGLAVAMVSQESYLNNGKAKISVDIASPLNEEEVSVGIRSITPDNAVSRMQISSSQFQWTQAPEHKTGTTELDVPKNAFLQCIVNYRDRAQHYWWLVDPVKTPNPNYAIYNSFDPNLEVCREFLYRERFKNTDARDFESAISWLLWMLGFRVAHLGGTPRTQEAADIVAANTRGDFLLIECTMGLLKAENKLAVLIERFEKAKRNLDASGNRHIRILPVIVTSKPLAEVKADLEQAERLGIAVFTREDIEASLNQLSHRPDSNVLFDNVAQRIADNMAKHQQSASPISH